METLLIYNPFQIKVYKKGYILKNISIKNKLFLIVFSSIVLVSTIITIDSIKNLQDVVDINVKKYEEDAYGSKIQELNNYTTMIIHKIKHFHEMSQGKSPLEIDKAKV